MKKYILFVLQLFTLDAFSQKEVPPLDYFVSLSDTTQIQYLLPVLKKEKCSEYYILRSEYLFQKGLRNVGSEYLPSSAEMHDSMSIISSGENLYLITQYNNGWSWSDDNAGKDWVYGVFKTEVNVNILKELFSVMDSAILIFPNDFNVWDKKIRILSRLNDTEFYNTADSGQRIFLASKFDPLINSGKYFCRALDDLYNVNMSLKSDWLFLEGVESASNDTIIKNYIIEMITGSNGDYFNYYPYFDEIVCFVKEKYPDCTYDVLSDVASCCYINNDYAKAAEIYLDLYRTYPKRLKLIYNIADNLDQAHKYDELFSFLMNEYCKDVDNQVITEAIGYFYMKTCRISEGLEIYESISNSCRMQIEICKWYVLLDQCEKANAIRLNMMNHCNMDEFSGVFRVFGFNGCFK
ncbi:hypothetical protein DSECCO2_538290 [anaerobic digester metagenome]